MKKKIILAVVISLAALTVAGLSAGLGIAVNRQKSYERELENLYRKSYYEAADSISDIETKLSKLSVVGGTTLKKEILKDIWRQCEMAESNLSQLSSKDGSITDIIKFVNQLGDYSYFLSNKVEDAGSLDETELKNLESFRTITVKISDALNSVKNELHSGGNLLGRRGENLNYFETAFADVKKDSVDYPELIYDGPFSDGLNDRTPKYLEGLEEISSDEGRGLLAAQLFTEEGAIEYIGESGGNIPSYVYRVKNGEAEGTAQLSKAGGKLVSYNACKTVDSPVLTDEECEKKAEYFASHLGYEGLKAVWVSNNNSTVYVNLAYVENDVVYYPDLVKVKVSAKTGEILGVEAQNFIYNHTERQIAVPENFTITSIEGAEVLSERWALIPTEWNGELLTKELQIEKGGTSYFIYVGAESKEEEKVLIVVDENGALLR